MIPSVLKPLVVLGLLTFVDMAVLVLQPLVWSTKIKFGGLGLSPYEIGVIKGVWGVANAIFAVSFVAPIMNRFGPKKVLVATFASYATVLALYPLQRWLIIRAGKIDGWTIAVVTIQLMLTFIISPAYGKQPRLIPILP
jgi:hypothetical protein